MKHDTRHREEHTRQNPKDHQGDGNINESVHSYCYRDKWSCREALVSPFSPAEYLAERRRLDVAIQTTALEERRDVRFAAGEILELLERIFAAAAGKKRLAKTIAILAGHAAVLLDPLHGVGIEDFAPDIGVVTRGVIAGEGVRKIRTAIARRHGRKIDPGFLQRLGLECEGVFRDLVRLELMPGLVEQRRGEVFRGLEALVEFS